MFNRRDPESQATGKDRPTVAGSTSSGKSSTGFIGPSIQIEGTVLGNEDLLVEGEIRGKIELKSNKLTIGKEGRVFADVHARQVCVEGRMDGHLVVLEQLDILSTARIKGNITAPRISLKDGARFNGSIDMDPETRTLTEVFGDPGATVPSAPAGPRPSDDDSESAD